ncbi:MAG: orotidine-5'-phosphate decarboxylase [candidate division Zixibacteria bacterium]|nr:orotidine-5'-phosphate decarboxylase [candidate division Zixibacteria bacterium]
MNAPDKLLKAQSKNNSLICLGLDLDPKRMPKEYTNDTKGMFSFAIKIIEATSDVVCAYKPNLAFYESFGRDGMSLLRMITERIPSDVPVIVDGKRGDIGNTAAHYAQAIFEGLKADWVTLNPYMGYDSMRPFLEYKNKGTFILCLTSNSGSKDFQLLEVDGKPLYRIVAEKVSYWNKSDNCGLVIGATAPEQLTEIREVAGDMPLLIPGVGAQGGSLEKAAINGTANFTKPAIINVSRSVLYASSKDDFATKAREELIKLNTVVNRIKTGNGEEESPDTENQPTDKAETKPEQPQSTTENPSPPKMNS